MTTIIARAAESTHWYGIDGAPQYTVKAKDGSDRPTTLRDARKLNLVPSVTTILKVASKPALDVWKQEQLLLAALTLPQLPNEPEKEFIKRILQDSKETAKLAAERGTRIHESIENYFRGGKKVEHLSMAQEFAKKVEAHFGTHPLHPWVTEESFASAKGYGGKVDLYSPKYEDVPEGIVLDAKTKEFDYDDVVPAYDENLMQLAAYRMGLNLPHARCANVFVSVTRPGLVKIHEWTEEDLIRGWRMFCALLKFWQLKNKFGDQ